MNNRFLDREKDWKNGPVVYQVIVDRFAPSEKLEEKRSLYQAPLSLKNWKEQPRRQGYNKEVGAWQHELDFWGGDLASLLTKLDYLKSLSVDVIYLNPIFKSLTNHKYDTHDYFTVDPVYGDNEEFRQLVEKVHDCGMKLMLDGVFNHVGRKLYAEIKEKQAESSTHLFRFIENEPVCWNNAHNLPELNLDNTAAQKLIYNGENSVVQYWIKRFDVDGWRLDVASELGFRHLRKINRSAKSVKPEAAVIGEIWNYPQDWFPCVDGVTNMHARSILLRMLSGNIEAREAMNFYDQMVSDCGIEHMLKSWLVLDNHDTPRLASVLKTSKKQALARILQFTLPGAVCLYYGSEFAMTGKNDPEQRGPMPWDKLKKPPAIFHLHEKLGKLRRSERALRIGDFTRIASLRSFSFMRTTDKVGETVIVAANPSARKIFDVLQLRDGRIHDTTVFTDRLTGKRFMALSGFLDLQIPACSALILTPEIGDLTSSYTKYKYLDE
ncbi:MAG: cyclomaltodextrinase [Candidatus Rifleibacteriota bacterium]